MLFVCITPRQPAQAAGLSERGTTGKKHALLLNYKARWDADLLKDNRCISNIPNLSAVEVVFKERKQLNWAAAPSQ